MMRLPRRSSDSASRSGRIRGAGLRRVLLAFLLVAQWETGPAHAQGGFLEEKAAPSSNPESMTAQTENPDDLTVGTENPDSMTVGTTALPGAVGSEQPIAQPGTGVSPDSLTVGTEALSDTPGNAGGYQQGENSGRNPNLIPSSPGDLQEAQAMLRRARSRLQVANTAVGNMMERDYPTGSARILLYDEKKSAERDVDQAEQWVEGFGGTP